MQAGPSRTQHTVQPGTCGPSSPPAPTPCSSRRPCFTVKPVPGQSAQPGYRAELTAASLDVGAQHTLPLERSAPCRRVDGGRKAAGKAASCTSEPPQPCRGDRAGTPRTGRELREPQDRGWGCLCEDGGGSRARVCSAHLSRMRSLRSSKEGGTS